MELMVSNGAYLKARFRQALGESTLACSIAIVQHELYNPDLTQQRAKCTAAYAVGDGMAIDRHLVSREGS